MSIPRILHFTWKTGDVPGRMGEYLAKWRKMHEEWDVRLWTDETMREFVAQDYPELLRVYDGYPRPIQRADAFRYLVLNRLGGVYSDLDVDPYRPIDGLVDGIDCFVGIEPYEHIGPDRRHSGVPYLLSNAFMGGRPGHPYFSLVTEMLPGAADTSDIFHSTGPSLTTGAGVRMPREDRPMLVPPCLWSPHCDGGKPCTSDDFLADMLKDDFDFIWADRRPYVSHEWLTSWVPFHKRHKWLAKPFHAMHRIKWQARAARFPQLASLPIRDQLSPFNDQTPKPVRDLPRVSVCMTLREGESLSSGLAMALESLDYPRDKLDFVLGAFVQPDGEQAAAGESLKRLKSAGLADVKVRYVVPPDTDAPEMAGWTPEHKAMAASAKLRNAVLSDVPEDADYILFVGGETGGMRPETLKHALSAGFPVVALGLLDAEGRNVDTSTHRYHWGGGIRVTYKIMDTDGIAGAGRGQRDFPSGQKAFRVVPLDGVGRGFVLVDRKVFDAGVRFAERPWHRHLDGEGFALMAREKGFEVAALTETSVTTRTD